MGREDARFPGSGDVFDLRGALLLVPLKCTGQSSVSFSVLWMDIDPNLQVQIYKVHVSTQRSFTPAHPFRKVFTVDP